THNMLGRNRRTNGSAAAHGRLVKDTTLKSCARSFPNRRRIVCRGLTRRHSRDIFGKGNCWALGLTKPGDTISIMTCTYVSCSPATNVNTYQRSSPDIVCTRQAKL